MLTALQHYNIWHIFICCLCKINHPTSWGLKLTCYFSQFHGFRGWLLSWSCLESVGLLPWGDSWTGRTSQEDFSRWRPWGPPSPPRGLSCSPSKVRISNQETRSTPGARRWKPQIARAPPGLGVHVVALLHTHWSKHVSRRSRFWLRGNRFHWRGGVTKSQCRVLCSKAVRFGPDVSVLHSN